MIKCRSARPLVFGIWKLLWFLVRSGWEERVSDMTHFVSTGTQNLNLISQSINAGVRGWNKCPGGGQMSCILNIRGDWKRGTGKRGTVKNTGVENAGLENVGPNRRGGKGRTGKHESKSQGWKRQDWKTQDQISRVENARPPSMER